MMNEIITREIKQQIDALLPHGSGVVTPARLQHALETVARRAYTVGGDDELVGLMDIDDAITVVNTRLGAAGRDKISKRRLQAIARNRHARFGIGAKKGGAWLFRASEIDSLMPREYDRGDA